MVIFATKIIADSLKVIMLLKCLACGNKAYPIGSYIM